MAIGVAVYAAACIWRAPDVIFEIKGAIGRRRRNDDSSVETLGAPH